MSPALALLAAVAAVNPFRVGSVLPGRDRAVVAAIGGLVSSGFLLLVALLSGPLLDGLEITPPTARIGAGLAVAVVGIRAVLTRPPLPEPSLAGRRAALVPVTFPVLVDPALTLLTLAVASERGVGPATAVAATAVAAALLIGLASTRAPAWGPVGHRFVGAVAMATGVAVTIAGVLDL